jgi:hypothetical protein
MSAAELSSATPAYPDRSVRLMIFGIFQILLGCLAGLMGLTMVAVATAGPMLKPPHGPVMNVRMMIPGIVFYFLLAVGFIWMGIGSIRARRWAWTLTVLLSWMGLVMGGVMFAVFVFAAGPMMRAAMEQQQAKMPPQALLVMQIVMAAFTACIYIGLPALFLLFYNWASVRATCQRRNPQICWTDRCPMPVLALTILLGVSVLSMPSCVVYGCVMPLFGMFVSGVSGAVVILLITLILAYLTWGTYRLRMAAWWGTLLLWIVGTANMVVTFAHNDLMKMYEKMGMPAEQMEMMRKMGFADWLSHWGLWLGLVCGAVWLGYLLYVRRYFVRARTGG